MVWVCVVGIASGWYFMSGRFDIVLFFVLILVFITRYMQPVGLWQRRVFKEVYPFPTSNQLTRL